VKKSNLSLRLTPKTGFALIITISMMILLALLAVGLLSLATVSVRSSSSTAAIAEARANARLAMMIALGELQKHVGPDQRITAPGDIANESAPHRHWTGVWDSWKAGKSDPSGGDQASDHATIPASLNPGMSPTYTEARADHFRSWLVSLPDGGFSPSVSSPQSTSLSGSVTPGSQDKAVKLVGEGSLGTAPTEDHVLAALNPITSSASNRGRIAWWVADESTKARLLEDETQDGLDSLAEQVLHHQAPGNTGHQLLEGLDGVEDSTGFTKSISRPSLELVEGIDQKNDYQQYFHATTLYSRGLLTDVREGGMKRDLSGLLSRPISTRDTSDDFMLYRFGRNTEQVPIQDLSAYYQLYKEQLEYSSRELRSGIQVKNPDFGDGSRFLREYTNLYRLPVPIKVQFLLSMLSEPRTDAEKRANPRNNDTHKLNVGITPAITLWNPYNVPLTMNLGAQYATQFRFFNLPMAIRWTKVGKGYTSTTPTSLAWLANGATSGDRDTGFTVYFSGTRPVIFEPGQVRVFSLANTSLNELKNSDVFRADREVVPGWDPERYIQLKRSDRSNNAAHIEPPSGDKNGALTFSAGDSISFSIEASETQDLANGSALQFFNRQSSAGQNQKWMARQFQLVSRMSGAKTSFNRDLMNLGLPDGKQKLEYEPKSGREIISGAVPFLLVNLMAGCETAEASNQGSFAGRQFPSRPFLHSSPITGTVFIDRSDSDALYQHGWNWWVDDINSAFEANVSIDRSNNGYYGGGYTAESGTTHVVQQEIPVAPPISIASLSHAQLGGFSLGNAYLGPGASETNSNFQALTASGQGGLFPQTLQAIGNSYAHPHLAPDRAYGNWTRNFTENARAKSVVFADHSYLANKALWDEYFFSSIADARTQAFSGSIGGSPQSIAQDFFFGSGKLLNSRFEPYLGSLTEDTLKTYFSGSTTNFDGIDELASHIIVKGPFNINSTSVDAWRALFASLRGKSIAYLDAKRSLGQTSLKQETIEGTPIAGFSMPNGQATIGSQSDSAEPEQWTGWRELTDEEIDELAVAMVEQVRLRGPFLSLSEFVNRRLDGSKKELSLKGALQAALDDKDVSINSGFKSGARSFSNPETSELSPEFSEALEGPIAYGSAAYVDQADILRGLAGQLTPRGDTFVIRTYGDSLDPAGKVLARAWCEAVVQRVPDYLDPSDEDFEKTSDLKSEQNQKFGRQIRIVNFRFLKSTEV